MLIVCMCLCMCVLCSIHLRSCWQTSLSSVHVGVSVLLSAICFFLLFATGKGPMLWWQPPWFTLIFHWSCSFLCLHIYYYAKSQLKTVKMEAAAKPMKSICLESPMPIIKQISLSSNSGVISKLLESHAREKKISRCWVPPLPQTSMPLLATCQPMALYQH